MNGKIISFDLFLTKDVNSFESRLIEVGFENSVEGIGKDRLRLFKTRDRNLLFQQIVELCGSAWKVDAKLLSTYLGEISLQVLPDDRQYTPLPYHTVAIVAAIRNESLIREELEKNIWNVANALGIFLLRMGGLSGKVTNSIASPFILELRILMEKEEFKNMNRYANDLYNLTDRSFESVSEASKKLRGAEPISFSKINSDLDYHSVIVGLDNLSFIAGCMAQPGLGGLYRPYFLIVTTDENAIVNPFITSDRLISGGLRDYSSLLIHGGQTLILPLLSVVWLEYLGIEIADTDRKLEYLRKKTESSSDGMEQILEEMCQMGLKQISTIEALEFVARCQKDGLIIGTSRNDVGFYNKFMKDVGCGPIHLAPSDSAHPFNSYLQTLAETIERGIDNALSKTKSQEMIIHMFENRLTNMVQLKSMKTQQIFSKRIFWFTVALFVTAVVSILISLKII